MHRLIGLLAVVVLTGCTQATSVEARRFVRAEKAQIGEALVIAPETIEQLADRWGVTIAWSNNPEVNCGVAVSLVGEGGCYIPEWANIVWLSEGMDDMTTRDVLLHEIGHVLQARNGEPSDECAAEAFAHSQGAPLNLYDCP